MQAKGRGDRAQAAGGDRQVEGGGREKASFVVTVGTAYVFLFSYCGVK